MNMLNITVENFRKTAGTYLAAAKKIPWALARHAFLSILIFVCLELAAGAVIFYEYVFLPKTVEIQLMSGFQKFQDTIYHSVIEERATRQAVIDNSATGQYNNPF